MMGLSIFRQFKIGLFTLKLRRLRQGSSNEFGCLMAKRWQCKNFRDSCFAPNMKLNETILKRCWNWIWVPVCWKEINRYSKQIKPHKSYLAKNVVFWCPLRMLAALANGTAFVGATAAIGTTLCLGSICTLVAMEKALITSQVRPQVAMTRHALYCSFGS